jgi:hypothetical protein
MGDHGSSNKSGGASSCESLISITAKHQAHRDAFSPAGTPKPKHPEMGARGSSPLPN